MYLIPALIAKAIFIIENTKARIITIKPNKLAGKINSLASAVPITSNASEKK